MIRKFLSPFATGLLFLAPVLLTLILLNWLSGYLIAALGPNTPLGYVLGKAGMFFTPSPLAAFWTGIGMAALLVWVIGLAVQTRFRQRLEGGLDGLIARIPVLGPLYRPLAQFVRMMGSSPGGEMSGMSVVSVSFSNHVEALALLTSPRIHDFGQGPRYLILIPTAPVPVGGGMLFVETGRVKPVPSMGVDDLAKLYVTMGTLSGSERAS
ncbi:DUF502 domain-containing protein [Sandarakinorhabdus oryzae]|uniref:DUF502 domain-containing protein n=1 Tax=Sandarakinorhabdus oryzae TaxID=2675220 RepID=UPI0012E0F9E0|nr:DUF502 domain-containing protein [Sandarakinorhabdus oryzae]